MSRFIPAHAGNISRLPAFGSCRTVHPRTRGEHTGVALIAVWSGGSSPHTRGTSSCWVYVIVLFRFIPAHAGNIGSSGLANHTRPVHPRTRGEHLAICLTRAMKDGSSPHTRGTYAADEFHALQVRFIPAHAGNMARFLCPRVPGTVHPRTRGEHPGGETATVDFTGSSPHTRGT